MLWDGAFSLASKVNPTHNDIQLFRQYVRAAIWSHQALNISITHKVHLMWWHVAIAMELPGGLGKKREDWLEKQHQEGSLLRKQYRTTQQQDLRAEAMAGATHRDSRPEVVAKMREVDKNAERGPRPGYIKKEEQNRLGRESSRVKALAAWETINSQIIEATGGPVSRPVPGGYAGPTLVAKLPPVGDVRVLTWGIS